MANGGTQAYIRGGQRANGVGRGGGRESMRWIPVLCYLAVKAGQVFAQGVTDDDEPPPFIPKTNLDFGGSIISTEPSLQGTVVVVTTSAGTPVTLSVSGSAFVPTYTETAGPDTPAALQSTSTLAPSTSTLAPSTSSQTPSAGTVLDVDATPSSARPVDLVSSAASDDAPPFISKVSIGEQQLEIQILTSTDKL